MLWHFFSSLQRVRWTKNVKQNRELAHLICCYFKREWHRTSCHSCSYWSQNEILTLTVHTHTRIWIFFCPKNNITPTKIKFSIFNALWNRIDIARLHVTSIFQKIIWRIFYTCLRRGQQGGQKTRESTPVLPPAWQTTFQETSGCLFKVRFWREKKLSLLWYLWWMN